MTRSVLITGATGYIGKRIARDYLDRGRNVIICLRGASDDEVTARAAELDSALSPEPGKLAIVRSELTDANPFEAIDPGSISEIVHSAAVTRFNVEQDLARAVNLEGSIKLFEFARRCAHLDHFGMLSTLYATGLVEGDIPETALAASPEFANHYEWSKWEAEQALASTYTDLPWSIIRLGTVIADDTGGAVTQQNAVHNTLKLFFYGLLSLLPGAEETPLYFVTGDFCADAVMAVMHGSARHGYYHGCHERQDTVTLKQFADIAFDRFESEPDFHARKILRPLICDRESFELLAEGIDSFGGAVVNQGLKSVRPFVRQMYSPKSFSNANLRALMPGYQAPDPSDLLTRAVDSLVATRWGKRPRPAEEAA